MTHQSQNQGFTLIELMVTIALLAILVAMAVPSFTAYQQRATLRGAGDQLMNYWANARLAAVRENRNVIVSFRSSGNNMCIGATTAAAACDCLNSPGACNISRFPDSQAEWRRTRVAAASTLGAGSGNVIIDPKRGNITAPGDAGGIFLRSPQGSGSTDYRLNFMIDRNGRGILCEPAAAPSKMPQYSDRQC
ncbi:pilus assembly FimT family protein [Lysobacter tyrosinilyticus]